MSRGEASPVAGLGGEAVPVDVVSCMGEGLSGDASPLQEMGLWGRRARHPMQPVAVVKWCR